GGGRGGERSVARGDRDGRAAVRARPRRAEPVVDGNQSEPRRDGQDCGDRQPAPGDGPDRPTGRGTVLADRSAERDGRARDRRSRASPAGLPAPPRPPRAGERPGAPGEPRPPPPPPAGAPP